MAIDELPEFEIFTLDLSSAGYQDIDLPPGYIKFFEAVDAADTFDATAKLTIKYGDSNEDGFPFRIHTEVQLGKIIPRKCRLTWAAHSVATVGYVAWAADPAAFRMITVPRTSVVQVTGGRADTLDFSAKTVDGTAKEVFAGNTARRGAKIYNNGVNTVYLGRNATVTTANGFPLPPGATFETDDYTGAIWGITAGTSEDLRRWDEYVA